MRKRFVSSILCLVIVIVAMGVPLASAVNLKSVDLSEGPKTRWQHTRSIALDMSFNNRTITSNGTITGHTGTTGISAIFILERLVNNQYEFVDSWTATSSTIILTSSRTTQNCDRGTYKLSVTAWVTRNGTLETVSDSLTKTF